MSAADPPDSSEALKGVRVAFAGKLGGMTRRAAQSLIRDHGGIPVDEVSGEVDLVVLGADELPLDESSLLDDAVRQRAAEGELEIISETQFWQRLGMFDEEADVRLYTPAMLAELLGVSVSIIRRWHRRMPLLLGFALVALFIWLAENVGTYTHAWLYPAQRAGWHPVPLTKLGSWLLLMVISYVMVSAVHRRGAGR